MKLSSFDSKFEIKFGYSLVTSSNLEWDAVGTALNNQVRRL